MSLHAKSYVCGYVMFLCKIDKEWSYGCWVMSGFMIICCWCCFWNMLLMNWLNGYSYLWIGDENCCCCWKFVKVWWIILVKWCFNLKFYASLSVFSCIWPVNIIGNEFWVGKDQNWDFWRKWVWNSKFFSGLMNVRLSEPSASSKRAYPVDSGHSLLERAVSERN